jgi:hypothetical protein
VTLHVSDKRLGPVVDHLHRAAGDAGEETKVDMEGDIFPGSKGSSDASRVTSHLVWSHVQTVDDLTVIDVDPLGGRV